MPAEHDRDAFLHDIAADLHEHFGIDHTTLQIERDPKACALEPADVV